MTRRTNFTSKRPPNRDSYQTPNFANLVPQNPQFHLVGLGKEVVVKNNKLKLKYKRIKALCCSQLSLMLLIAPLSSQIISCVSSFRLDMACPSSSATVLSSTLVLSTEILERTHGVM
ncbi:MAG: hypothetical protein EZS28_017778 [Streblomastix strix]|uniref:Uncharacterized protein n=1 Tax=Streblomastix strix TaxID=222440 RepID=A0A5J4VVQ7_9EUKA|nr:MAG: hypothetical protein EZS28_017778 [Streblomastix strix]